MRRSSVTGEISLYIVRVHGNKTHNYRLAKRIYYTKTMRKNILIEWRKIFKNKFETATIFYKIIPNEK